MIEYSQRNRDAEEYAAKIVKLQKACLTPLKEDLADWLNKIMNVSHITSDNFMDKLDNGVILCRLAKIISLWCEQQLQHTNTFSSSTSPSTTTTNSGINLSAAYKPCSEYSTPQHKAQLCHNNRTSSLLKLDSTTNNQFKYRTSSKLSTSTQSVHSTNNGAIKWRQTKIWDNAKCRTFYARDNVCNFIRWSKEFGVNQSVLFESDDLVLHGNTRQVVLCLLDVARIAYVKYNFTEAPGFVKFEQELGNERSAAAITNGHSQTNDDRQIAAPQYDDRQLGRLTQGVKVQSQNLNNDKSETRPEGLRHRDSAIPILSTNPTDDLIMRYCLHREEEAARKKAAAAAAEESARVRVAEAQVKANALAEAEARAREAAAEAEIEAKSGSEDKSSEDKSEKSSEENESEPSIASDLDSKVMRSIASDLDGKVMRIAKSYYGKGATKGVTRLSEGKYRIADRIVFVRLLKGQKVMVRIGGGWVTLENFLFRHKSDPSQVIDVDNLLPLETKLTTFDKTPVSTPKKTPTNTRYSKIPQYRRANSGSSTSLHKIWR